MVTLTPQQESACQALVEFSLSEDKCIILQGHAGTGKTTIINQAVERITKTHELLKSLHESSQKLAVHFTAMTHKARHELASKTDYNVSTLHNLLKIPVKDSHVFNPEAIFLSHRYKNIIIVDECSYIDYTILDCINQVLQCYDDIKFIFIGDEKQLPPVGFNHCPIFKQGYPIITLSQVVRQQHSPILGQVCELLRQAVADGHINSLPTDDEQVQLLDKKQWNKTMLQSFQEGRNVKVIRYTNHQTQQANAKVFRHLKGRKEMQVGDIVINNSYHKRMDTAPLYADTCLEILSIEPEHIMFNVQPCKVNRVLAKQVYGEDTHDLYLPHKDESSYPMYVTNHVITDLRHEYACTVHKAQGSTYDEVFINLNDFKNAYKRDKKEAFRLLYVAFSRARHKVYVTGDIV